MEQPNNPPPAKPKAKIIIDGKWCKKCGICIAFCPQGVFVADDFGAPLIVRPEKCVKCMLCVVRCPDLAVDVVDAPVPPSLILPTRGRGI